MVQHSCVVNGLQITITNTSKNRMCRYQKVVNGLQITITNTLAMFANVQPTVVNGLQIACRNTADGCSPSWRLLWMAYKLYAETPEARKARVVNSLQITIIYTYLRLLLAGLQVVNSLQIACRNTPGLQKMWRSKLWIACKLLSPMAYLAMVRTMLWIACKLPSQTPNRRGMKYLVLLWVAYKLLSQTPAVSMERNSSMLWIAYKLLSQTPQTSYVMCQAWLWIAYKLLSQKPDSDMKVWCLLLWIACKLHAETPKRVRSSRRWRCE